MIFRIMSLLFSKTFICVFTDMFIITLLSDFVNRGGKKFCVEEEVARREVFMIICNLKNNILGYGEFVLMGQGFGR